MTSDEEIQALTRVGRHLAELAGRAMLLANELTLLAEVQARAAAERQRGSQVPLAGPSVPESAPPVPAGVTPSVPPLASVTTPAQPRPAQEPPARIGADLAALTHALEGLPRPTARVTGQVVPGPTGPRYEPPAFPVQAAPGPQPTRPAQTPPRPPEPAAAPTMLPTPGFLPPEPPPAPSVAPTAVRVPTPAPRVHRQVPLAKIFAIVGAVITLIGVAFSLVLAAQYGYFGPIPRTVAAGLLSAVATGVAVWVHRKDPQNVGAQALLATGIAGGFLTTVALTIIYGVEFFGSVQGNLGLILAGLVGLAGVWMARRRKSEWLAILAVLGSLLLAPYLGPDPLWTQAFMVVFTIASASFQQGLGWMWLTAARTLPTVVVFLVWINSGDPLARVPGTVFLAVLLTVAGLAMAVVHQRERGHGPLAAVVAMIVMTTPQMVLTWMADQLPAVVGASVMAVAFTAVGFGRRWVKALLVSAAIPLGGMFALFALLVWTDRHYPGIILFALAAVYLAVAVRSDYPVVLILGGVLAVVGVLAWLPRLGALASVPITGTYGVEHIVESLLGVLVTVLVVLALRIRLSVWREWMSYAAWGLALMFGSVAIVLSGTTIGGVWDRQLDGFQGGHAVVTVSWMLVCVALLRLGLRGRGDPLVPVRIAVALAIGAVAKLFLFDLATLPDLVRAVAFIVVGVILLVIGTWYARALERVRRGQVPRADVRRTTSGPPTPPTPPPTF